ncbi:MAG: alginate export family protein, partial [Candidatus Hydrogenedentes bacterium]|nr:alginate export family protein [Candidatus Hydrogenedentota bacterium]
MRLTLTALLAVMIIGLGVPAFAELQNVEVGGAIRIRGNYWGAGAAQLSFDDNDADNLHFEQRTLINVKADFTDDVTAFIELDSYNLWGDDFRANVLSGVDNQGATDIGLYQAYIEMREAWGYPLTFKIGRQEIQLGSEWLVGNNDTASNFKGLSFDAVVASYAADQFTLTGLWARLVQDTAPLAHDDDADLVAVYASYTGLEDMTIDGYWIWARAPFPIPAAETADFHTVGARFAGVYTQFDWDVEGAFQFGDSGAIVGQDQEAFGFTGDVGYTFDIEYQPRVFVTGTYYSGDDKDAPFNRLFSDHEDSEFLGNTELSNYWMIGGGASAQVTEEIEVSGVVSYFQIDEDFGAADDDVGLELGLYSTYNYSEDLYFEAGYAHFFTGDAIGNPGDDLNYFYLETGL